MFEISKIYMRSLVGMVVVGVMICYGMYLSQITADVQLAALAVIASCVLFDKPKITE